MLDNDVPIVYHSSMDKRVKRFNISLSPKDLKALDSMSVEAGRSRSGMIADMVRMMAAVRGDEKVGLLLADAIKAIIQDKR